MTELSTPSRPKRPEFRNLNAFSDLPSYRWPLAAIVSGMHRASGLILFLLMPFIIWMFDTSVTSEVSFAKFVAVFNVGTHWVWSSFSYWTFKEPVELFISGWIFKLVALALIWAYLHHFFAGLRHIRMDMFHTVSKEQGKSTAQVVLVLSLGLTLVLGAKLFGLY